MTVYNAP